MPLGMEVGLGIDDFVFDGDPAPPEKKHSHIHAHVGCGQTAGWIKMPLGTEVNVGPGDVVLDGVAAPPPQKKGGRTPQFSFHVYYGQTAGWIKTPLCTEVDLGPGHIVLDGERGTAPHPSPSFRLMSVVATSPISVTDELLFWMGMLYLHNNMIFVTDIIGYDRREFR